MRSGRLGSAQVEELIYGVGRELREHGLFPTPEIVEGPTTEPIVSLRGEEVLQFCTGNYLGLATHPDVKAAAVAGIERYGLTSSGSRLVCGTQEPQLELEREVADFEGVEAAVLYFLVTVANTGAIVNILRPPLPQLMRELGLRPPGGKREILFDWLSHPSVVEARVTAVGEENVRPYRHVDMNDLERKLKKSDAHIRLIATDGLFSTDGDLAPLPDIVGLADRYGAMVFVDDAHATGVYGAEGRGTWEHFGVEDRVDIKVGSLAKAFGGGLGAFVVGDGDFADYLRVTGGHYIFGGSVPPAVAMAITACIRTARRERWRRKAVLENAEYLRERLRCLGFDTLGSVSQIVPILIGADQEAIAVSAELLEQGILIPPFRYPAVPHGKARLRATLMATHTREQIERFLETLVAVADKHDIRRPC